MQNINAGLSVEALNSENDIITQYKNNDENVKIIPMTENQGKIFLSFSSTIIDGKVNFFDEYKKLSFELRLVENNSNFNRLLKSFEIDLINEGILYESEYVDFKIFNNDDIADIDLTGINVEEAHYILILVRHPKMNENDKWIVQSAIPVEFQKLQ